MPRSFSSYIVEFEPNATMHTAHHILLFGCSVVGYRERDTPRAVWDCGEMGGVGRGSQYRRAPVCSEGSHIIYAWARDAPKLTLPEGVGFKVGGRDSGINYLLLQVHYANVDKFIAGETDNSGIILTVVPGISSRVTKRAGVLLLGTDGRIPAHKEEHMETECMIQDQIEIHPFAFRTHTHQLGKLVAGYVVKPNGQWLLIGKHDPLKPQMFYPVQNNLTILQGDIVAARCTMKNFRDVDTEVGPTGNDEMCNFYLMYYVEGDRILGKEDCFSPGPPIYRWHWDSHLGSIPNSIDKDASTSE
ncbi:peptidylglycine alpha-hydroxylating monooxygenase-like isoform X2 [Tachypleus tridentatus]